MSDRSCDHGAPGCPARTGTGVTADNVKELLAHPRLCPAHFRAITRQIALRALLREYVEWHGPCADHHRDDCPGRKDGSRCRACEIDAGVNLILTGDRL